MTAVGATGTMGGPLAFVFTDVVGSTKLWAADPQATSASFVVHDRVVRASVEANGGTIFGWAGDSFRASFPDPVAAVEAAEQIHRALAATDWVSGPPLRVRIGVNHGPAIARDGEYFGPTLNTTARLEQAAQPGQTVLSGAAAAELAGRCQLSALGRHRLRDVADPIDLYQVGEASFLPLRTVDAAMSTLPPVVGALVGRSSTVSQVRTTLDDGVPVTIVGTGGAGKTRLALEVGHLELSDHPDGCYFVDLSSVKDANALAPAIAQGCRIKVNGPDPLRQIVDHFENRAALVILDNCEHLVGPLGELLPSLVAVASDLAVLATSRQPLGLAAERVVNLGPLATAQDGPAVKLFVQRVRDLTPTFSPGESDLTKIAEICAHLDGIPLAVELAAARAGLLGLDYVLDGMHDRFRLLSSSRADGAGTLREAIDWSFGLLDPDEQDFFARCGIFTGSFDLRAAAAVAPHLDPIDVADLLHSLVDKSLLVVDGEVVGRFRLLETIRAYALLRLKERQVDDHVGRLHFVHYRNLVAVDDLVEAGDIGRAVRLSREWTNIEAALAWGIASEAIVDASRIAVGSIGMWDAQVPALVGKRWLETLIAKSDPADPITDRLKYALAGLEAQLDDFERVYELIEDLIANGHPDVRARSLALSGYLLARRTPERSPALFERAEQVIETHDLDDEVRVTLAWACASYSLYQADFEAAHDGFKAGFEIAKRMSVRTTHAVFVGHGLVAAQILLGRPAEAIATLDSYDWSNSRWDSSPVLRGVALIDVGQIAAAADLLINHATESLRGRLLRMSNDAMVGLAALALNRDETDRAWDLLGQAVTPRTPFTIALAEGLADRLGHGDDLRAIHRTREVSLVELDAIERVRAELDRINPGRADRPEADLIDLQRLD